MEATETLTFEKVWAMFQEIVLGMKETDKRIGELSNRFGEPAEHLVAPSIKEVCYFSGTAMRLLIAIDKHYFWINHCIGGKRMRKAEITRTTSETDITINLDLDGSGNSKLDYPIGFMKHMLDTFARHGLFDLDLRAKGDLEIDQHHLVEDTGIVLGSCFAKALGDRRGIVRCGSCLYPMDETLA
ncbi:MAG: hypothetical protein LBH07_09080, partial [Treponema sp.]|nr:hypothetical protein [Treponema sp.]